MKRLKKLIHFVREVLWRTRAEQRELGFTVENMGRKKMGSQF